MPDDTTMETVKTGVSKSPWPLWWKLRPVARENRQRPTPAEERLWRHLRNRQIKGLKFRRQTAFSPFVVDFYCADHRLVIEVDGSIHASQLDEDAERQAYLETLGLRVIRFSNEQVLEHLEDALQAIVAAVKPE